MLPCFACVQTGEVSLKVSAEALKTAVLCGNKTTTVPKMGRIDTVVRTLLVQVSNTPTPPKIVKVFIFRHSLFYQFQNTFIKIYINNIIRDV